MKPFFAAALSASFFALPFSAAEARTLEICYGTAHHCAPMFPERAPQDVAYGACLEDMLTMCEVKYGAEPGLLRRMVLKRLLRVDPVDTAPGS